MSATSANKVINNQVGSADAESDETVEGLGDGVELNDGVGLGDGVGPGDAVKLGDGVAASTTPLTGLDGPCDKLAIRNLSTAYPPSPSLDPIASRVRIGLSVLLCS
jgi:hypothetical protein